MQKCYFTTGLFVYSSLPVRFTLISCHCQCHQFYFMSSRSSIYSLPSHGTATAWHGIGGMAHGTSSTVWEFSRSSCYIIYILKIGLLCELK